jgi:hypothetical protein
MNHEEPVNEAVDVDARTGIFKRTLTRLEQNRLKREGKIDKYAGLYNDGSGRGASVPNPINLKKESQRLSVEIDGRIKGLREAMKRVEMYRKLREEKKKKTLMSAWKEETEVTETEGKEVSLQEATGLTKGQMLDASDRNGRGWVVREEELSPAQKKYREFFQKALEKFGAKSPADLDDAKKKKFFNYIKKNYEGDAAKAAKDIGVDPDKIPADDARKIAKKKAELDKIVAKHK